MNIGLINGSSKTDDKFIISLIDEFKGYLNEAELCEMKFLNSYIEDEDIVKMLNVDTLVFVFPLCFDTLPANLISCLKELENINMRRPLNIYALCSSVYYDGEKCRNALDIMKNWTIKSGFVWRGGLGVGGEAKIINVKPDKGERKNLSLALRIAAEEILRGKKGEKIFVSLESSKFFYEHILERRFLKKVR